MSFIDISVTLSKQLHGFPGDPAVDFASAGPGNDPFHLTRMQLGSHAGTHIDAPAHLLKGGTTVDAIPLETLVGPCRVIDLRGRTGPITAADLANFDLTGVRRLLLRTDNSALWQRTEFSSAYTGLTPEAATHLVELGLQLVGIDYLSIEPYDGDGEVHRRLLEAGVVILEGLDLTAADTGDFELLCLPLKLGAVDGAPCRAVLRPLP